MTTTAFTGPAAVGDRVEFDHTALSHPLDQHSPYSLGIPIEVQRQIFKRGAPSVYEILFDVRQKHLSLL